MNKQANANRPLVRGRNLQARIACLRLKSYLKRSADERRFRLLAGGAVTTGRGVL